MVRPQTILNSVSGLTGFKQISMQALCLNDQAYNCLIHTTSCIKEDNLKNEDDLKNEVSLKSEDNLKN